MERLLRWRKGPNRTRKGIVLACLLALAGCKGLTAVDAFTSDQETNTAETDDARAITPAAEAYDYGPVFSEDAPKPATVVLQNVSKKIVYIQSIAVSQNANFSIKRHDCPAAPSSILPGDTCTVTAEFGPREAGNLNAKLTVKFGFAPTEETYARAVDLVGVGVKPLVFAGLDPVNPALVTTTRVTLGWPAVEGAASYAVYDMTTTPTLITYVPANQNSYQVTGLSANTTYLFRVKALNALGYADVNKTDRTVTTDSPGSFSAVSALSTNEGTAVTSASLVTACTDSEGNAPSSVLLTAQSDSTLNCAVITAPFRLQCTPGYKAGQAAWSGTATLSCQLNDYPSALTRAVTVNVANTNRAPVLGSVANQSVTAGNSLSTVTPSASDTDGDGLSFTCVYDTLADGAVASTAPSCASLINYNGSAATFSASTGAFAWTPPLSAANHVYEFKITAADPSGATASSVFTATVAPTPASAAHSTLAASAGSVSSGGAVTVTLTARDLGGTVLPYGGATVVFGQSGGTSTGSFSAITDHGDGTYTATYTGATAGTATTLTATLNGVSLVSGLPTVTVLPGSISAAQSTVTVSASSVNAGSAVTVTLTARDAANNRLNSGGSTVLFSRTGGTSTGTFSSVVDHGDGTYTSSFTGVAAGTATTLAATINGIAVTTSPPTVTVAPGAFSLAQSLITAGATSLTAGASTPVTLTVRDAHANPTLQSGLVVTFSTAGGTSAGSFGAVVDNGNGTYSAVFTATTAGTATSFAATLNGGAVTSSAPTLVVSPGAISLAQSVVSVAAGTVQSGASVTVTLTARDAYANALAAGGATIVFSHSGGTSTGSLSTVTDHNNGTYTSSFTGVNAGTATTLAATVNGSPVTTTLPSLAVNTGIPSAAQSTITVSTATLASGSTATLTFTARDVNGNALSLGGATVTLAVSGGTSTGNLSAVTDNQDGTYTANFTGLVAGTAATVTGTLNGSGLATTPPTITVVPGTLSLARSSLSVSSATVVSGSTVTLTLTARDTNNNPLTTGGATVVLGHAGGSSTGVIGPVDDQGNGTYTATFTGAAAGTATTLSASVNGLPLTSTLPTLTVLAGAASTTSSTLSIGSSTLSSGSTSTVTLVARDTYGNALLTGGVTVAFSYAGGASTGTLSATTDTGTGTYTSTFTAVAAGSATTLHATLNGAALISTLPTVTVTAGAVSLAQSTLTVSSASVNSGSSITLNLTLRDANGNPTGSTGRTVVFSRSGGSSTGTIGSTLDNNDGSYAASFTGVNAGTATTIGATVNGSSVTNTLPTVTVNPGPISTTQSLVTVSSSIVGVNAAVVVTLIAKDAVGNTLAAGGATVAFSTSGGTSTGTMNTVSDNGNGTYTANFTGVTPGTALTLGATINGTSVSTTMPTVTVQAGNISTSQSLVTVSSPTVLTGGTVTVTFAAKDADGNSITAGGATVGFYTSGGSSSGSMSSTTDNGNGLYTATFTATTGGTPTTVNATVSGAPVTSTLPTIKVYTAFSTDIPYDALTEGQYNFSSSNVQLSGGVVRLASLDQTDDDNSSTGFGTSGLSGLTHDGTKLVVDGTRLANTEMDSTWAPQWNSIVGYWHLDGSAGVTVTQGSSLPAAVGVTGTISNVSAGTMYAGGQVNQSLSFDGVGYVTVATTLPTAAYTKSAWVYLNSVTAVNNIFSQGGGTGNCHGFYVNSGTITVLHNNVGYSSAIAVSPGRWYHVVTTFDPTVNSGELRFYVNGIRGPRVLTSVSTPCTTGTSMQIAAFGGGNKFSGSLDEVALWNKALTENEVLTIYNKQSGYYVGSVSSRVMAADASTSWTALGWKSTLPFGKPLPDGATSEVITDYSGLESNSLMANITGLWHLDETSLGGAPGSTDFADSSGVGNHGTKFGSPTPGLTGKFGHAVYLNSASSQSVSLPGNYSTLAYTKSAWIAPYGNGSILSGTSSGFLLTSGTLSVGHNGNNALVMDSVSLPRAVWTHVAATYNASASSGTLKLYRNGVMVGSTTSVSPPGSTNMELGHLPGVGSYFSGLIDEAAVWNRTLNDNEIQQLYQRGAGQAKFQIRTCAASTCNESTEPWLGPDGTNTTYFSEINNNTLPSTLLGYVKAGLPSITFTDFSLQGLTVANNRYAQYKGIIEPQTSTVSFAPDIKSVTMGPAHYTTTPPTAVYSTGIPYSVLTGFTAQTGANGCSATARYQLSKNGSTWYYHDGTSWVSGTSYSLANTASEVNAAIASFATQLGTGSLYVRAYLNSTGTSTCELDYLRVSGGT